MSDILALIRHTMSHAIDNSTAIRLKNTRRVVDGQSSNVSKSIERLRVSPAEMKDRFPFKKFLYWLLYRIAEYCLRAIIFLIPRIPHRLLVLLTSATVRLTFAIL